MIKLLYTIVIYYKNKNVNHCAEKDFNSHSDAVEYLQLLINDYEMNITDIQFIETGNLPYVFEVGDEVKSIPADGFSRMTGYVSSRYISENATGEQICHVYQVIDSSTGRSLWFSETCLALASV